MKKSVLFYNLLLGKMSAKAVKKQLKKKKEKKHLRRVLARRLVGAQNKQQMLQQQQLQIPANIQQPTKLNSVRSQLLNNQLMAQTLGYFPQQYGNITNERKIRQLKSDTQSANQQINNDKALIDILR